jgi:hypothetical protein
MPQVQGTLWTVSILHVLIRLGHHIVNLQRISTKSDFARWQCTGFEGTWKVGVLAKWNSKFGRNLVVSNSSWRRAPHSGDFQRMSVLDVLGDLGELVLECQDKSHEAWSCIRGSAPNVWGHCAMD